MCGYFAAAAFARARWSKLVMEAKHEHTVFIHWKSCFAKAPAQQTRANDQTCSKTVKWLTGRYKPIYLKHSFEVKMLLITESAEILTEPAHCTENGDEYLKVTVWIHLT